MNSTKMTVRTYTPVVTNMSVPADEARLAIIANSLDHYRSSNTRDDIFYIGTTTSNRDAYIGVDNGNEDIIKLAQFTQQQFSFNTPVKANSITPTSPADLQGWKNMSVSQSLHLADASIYNASNYLSFTSQSSLAKLKAKNITLHNANANTNTNANANTKSVISVSSSGTIFTAYDEQGLELKTVNLQFLTTDDVAEGTSNLYYTDERVSNVIQAINMQSSSVAGNMSADISAIVTKSSNNFINRARQIDANIGSYVTKRYITVTSNLQKEQREQINYINLTCNLLRNTISNVLKIFTPQLQVIDSNTSNYVKSASNDVLHILAASSNAAVQQFANQDKSTSNYIKTSSNEITAFLVITSNYLSEVATSIYANISNQTEQTSNDLYNTIQANSNYLTALAGSYDISAIQSVTDASNTLVQTIQNSSNTIALDITSNYTQVAAFLYQSATDLDSRLSTVYQTIDTRINTLTLDNISDANQSSKYITNDVYNNDLTVNDLTVNGSILPDADAKYSLGSSNKRWKDLYISGNTIYLGNARISVTNQGIEIKNNQNEYYDIIVSKLAIQDETNSSVTILQSTSNQINLAAQEEQAPAASLEKQLYTDDIIESSNLYYTDARAVAIVAASNILTDGYTRQTSNSLISLINALTTDKIANGTSNQYIVNGVFPRNLSVTGTLTASNLDIKGQFTYISTNVYETETLKITSSASDGPGLQLVQYGAFSNLVEFYNGSGSSSATVVITESGSIGIGSTVPTAKMDIVGNIKASGKVNSITVTEINYLSGVQGNVQSQINTVQTDTSNYTSNVYFQLTKQQTDSSNLAASTINTLNSNMYQYIDKSSNAFSSNAINTSNSLVSYAFSMNSNLLRYLSTNVSNVFNASIPDVSDKINARIDSITTSLNSYVLNTSNSLETSIRSVLNPITSRINSITSTEWVAITGANGSNTYYLNNIGIGGLPSATERLSVYGNIKFTGSINYTSSNELNFLTGTSSNIQTQINIVSSNLVTYTSNTSNAFEGIMRNTSNNIVNYATLLNSNFIGYMRNTSNTLALSIASTSNALNATYNRFVSQGYTPGQWSNVTGAASSNIYYLRGNVGVGTSNIGTSNILEITAGDMMITGGDVKKLGTYTKRYEINPVIWYQFNDDVINSNLLYDSNVFSASSVKYNMNIGNLFLGNNIYSSASSNNLVTSNYCFNSSNDLVVWYRFDNGNILADSSGNNSNLQYVYNINSTTDSISDVPIYSVLLAPILNTNNYIKGNSSVQFLNSAGNFGRYALSSVKCRDTTFVRTDQFTVSFWVYFAFFPSNRQYIISAGGVYPNYYYYSWAIYLESSSLRFEGSGGEAYQTDFKNIDTPSSNKWIHYAIKLIRPSGNYAFSTITVYKDGKYFNAINNVQYLYTGFSQINNASVTDKTFNIGKPVTVTSELLGNNTLLDDIRFYKRALTDNEIAAIYNGYSMENITNTIISNYLWKNAYLWNTGDPSVIDNGFLYYTNANNIQQLLTSFHLNSSFSIHFVFQTFSTSVTSQILYIGNTTDDFIRVYITNNTFTFQVGSSATATYVISANVYYIIDLIFTVSNGNIVLNIFSNGVNVQTQNTSILYNNIFSSVNLSGLVYYIGKYKNTNNDASPITLQDFRIFSYALSLLDIQALQTGVTFYIVPQYVTEKYSLERWQANSDYYTFGSTKYITYNDGNVGVGTTNPLTKLHVGPGTLSSTLSLAYFNSYTALTTGSTTINNICSVFDSSIWCKSTIAAASDSRIKKDINDIDDMTALEKITALSPKTYDYIDPLRGTDSIYGFLAQQVRSVIPEAVSLRREVVPDIFTIADCCVTIAGDCTIIIPPDINISWLQNKKVSIIDTSGYCEMYTVVSINPVENSFVIDRSILDSPKVFVYGSEVDDFHTLDKQYIYTLNVCATQILSRELDELENRVRDLERQYNVSETDYLQHQQTI